MKEHNSIACLCQKCLNLSNTMLKLHFSHHNFREQVRQICYGIRWHETSCGLRQIRERTMKEAPIAKLFKYRWLIFWIMAVAYVFVYFHRLCPAVVATDLQETFQASAGFIGLLASAYFYPYAVMQFPAGLLSDSLGPRKTATVFLVIAGVGSLVFGLAPTMEVAIAARVLVGLGVSMVFIPAMKILSQWFRVREFAFMTAILMIMGGVGGLTAATPLALMTGWVGWRVSFEIIGGITLVMALLVWIFVRNRPQDMGWPSLAEIDHIGPGQSRSAIGNPTVGRSGRVVSDSILLACCCVVFLYFRGILQLRGIMGRSVFHACVHA